MLQAKHRRRRSVGLALTSLLLTSLPAPTLAEASPRRAAPDEPVATAGRVEGFMVVDCLLPGKIRRLGRRTNYISPRRPIRTTAVDCQIRGGEFTEYDRADYRTALEVWRGEAAAGSAEAQYYVGQIYEKGLGRDPDFAAAAEWYSQAADQGYSAAQVSLGYLYEQGLGVEQDAAAALNLYRTASGLPDEMIVLEEAEYDALIQFRRDLATKTEEAEKMAGDLAELSALLEDAKRENRSHQALAGEVNRLQSELAEEQAAAEGFRSEIASLEKRLAAGSAGAGTAPTQPRPVPLPALPASLDYGPYSALVIANASYTELEPLPKALEAAREVAELLETRYGFEVRTLFDGTRYQILTELNRMRENLTEEHNVLVYYVGHSAQDSRTQRSWWQPIDAEADSRANWISERVISDQLDTIPARHLLVVADAAFSGLLTRSAVARLPEGMTDKKRRDHVKEMLKKRSRLAIASGRGPSPFTDTLREVLAKNDGVLQASSLYREVSSTLATSDADAASVPLFAPIRFARSDGGADFFFVPR